MATLGKIHELFDNDPRVAGREDCQLPFEQWEEHDDGIAMINTLDGAWVEFQEPPPELEGSNYSPTTANAADAQVLFTAANGTSDFYKCTSPTAAGESPQTNPEKWEAIRIPKIFERFLVAATVGTFRSSEGQDQKRREGEIFFGERYLQDAVTRGGRQVIASSKTEILYQ